MKLYHGTASRYQEGILQAGIRPRGDVDSNWDTHPSRPDLVYLTAVYPFYFALCASDNEPLLVVEVDSDKLDQSLFLPDEDFIAQAISRQTSLEDIHPVIVETLEDYQHYWEKSLGGLGNCSYKGIIPREAITRLCVFDTKERPELGMMMADPSIAVENYFFLGERKYKPLVAWMFGDRELIPTDFDAFVDIEEIKFWREQSKDRRGITVCTV